MKKVAVVTGCAKGIGKEIALDLAREGYSIIGTYNTSFNKIQDLEKKIESIGVGVEFYKLDLLNEEEIKNFYNHVKTKYKKIDLLVNNAALSMDNSFKLKSSKEFCDVLFVNLVAPFLLIQKFSSILGGGIIINIASTDGINTYSKLNMDYSASKAGLINLTRSLSLELENIKVYAICPNWVLTETIMEMDQDYLNQELLRIGQTKLILPNEVSSKVIDLIYSNLKSGSVIILEGEKV